MELRPIEIRAIRDDEVLAFRDAIYLTFGGDADSDPTYEERFRALVAPDRGFGAFDGGVLVATAATFAFDLAIPGGALPIAGLTMVTVRPTHRRRGILRRLIEAHTDDARRHGEGVSGLWASEATIYGRFGYGIAAEGDEISFHAQALGFGDGRAADEVELVDAEAAARLVPTAYQRATAARPGTMSRDPGWWRYRRFLDRPDARKGASPLRHVVASRDGAVVGYGAYRLRQKWTEGSAAGTVEIDELVASDPRAEMTLWRYLTRIDLFPNVSWWNAPVDSILPWIASDQRRIRRLRMADTLWLRIDDIARTLAARRYLEDGALRLHVHDPAAASDGETVELSVNDGVARCTVTDGTPDLRLDRATLGTLYLGGFAATQLGRAGRIAGDDVALATADRMFRWPVAPWCAEIF